MKVMTQQANTRQLINAQLACNFAMLSAFAATQAWAKNHRFIAITQPRVLS